MDISVVTPIYKGNRFIPGILRMMSENANCAIGLEIELILVNDYPDIPLEINNHLVNGFRVRTVENPKNMGIHAARINGINHADGTYIMMLDQDDNIEENALKKLYDTAQGSKAALSNGYAEDKSGNKKILFKHSKLKHVNDISYYFYFGNIIASPGLVMIKKMAIPNEWMDNILRTNGADDWLLWVLYLSHGGNFQIISECLYTHKNDGTNASNGLEEMHKSSEDALRIFEATSQANSKLCRIYRRRLQMRVKCMNDTYGYKKLLGYILNPDIAFYVYSHNH